MTLPINWKMMPIGDVCLKITKGTTPTTVGGRFTDEGIKFIKVETISEFGSLEEAKLAFIDEESHELLKRSQLEANDVLFSIAGAIGRTYLVKEEDLPANTNQALAIVRFNQDIVFPSYGFYALRSSYFQSQAFGRIVQCAQANVNLTQLSMSKIFIPPKIQQEYIVKILSSYDKLIENNRRRIQLLEQSARLLYREWFVYLRFPEHEHVKIIDGVPEGWEKSTIGEKVVLNYGKALNADDRIEGSYPVYGSSGVIGTHEKPLVKGPGIIIGRKGNVGSVFWSHKDFYPIDTVYFIDNETSSYYLYHALQNMQFINSDVAVPGLNRNFAYSRPYIIPDRKLLSLFEETVSPIHKQTHKLTIYNEKLREARDILLPHLMNGDIIV